MIYKTLHRKLKIEQHKFHVKPRSMNSVALERLAFPVPLVTPIVLLLKRHEHHLIMKGQQLIKICLTCTYLPVCITNQAC